MFEKKQAEDLLALDERQLYSLLASGSPEYRGKARADFSPRAFGERLFKDLSERIRSNVCPPYCDEKNKWAKVCNPVNSIGTVALM